MPSYSNYLYEMPGYFVRLRADEPEPEGHLGKYGVNLHEVELIEGDPLDGGGAWIDVVDGELVITPQGEGGG